MYIDRELFDECFCPAGGIGRVCLRGDMDIPEELVQIAKSIDGENYNPSCFSIDVFNGGAIICYTAEHEFVDLGYVCDNKDEVLQYYIKNASKYDLAETMKHWEG